MVLRDDVCAIAAEVKALSECHDVVITSGGLGPTLDDVTMQAVAGGAGRAAGGRQHWGLVARMCAAARAIPALRATGPSPHPKLKSAR